jgi:hypothetical protein
MDVAGFAHRRGHVDGAAGREAGCRQAGQADMVDHPAGDGDEDRDPDTLRDVDVSPPGAGRQQEDDREIAVTGLRIRRHPDKDPDVAPGARVDLEMIRGERDPGRGGIGGVRLKQGRPVRVLGQPLQPGVHVQRDASPVLDLHPLGLCCLAGGYRQPWRSDQHGHPVTAGDRAWRDGHRCRGRRNGGHQAEGQAEQHRPRTCGEAASVTEAASPQVARAVRHAPSLVVGLRAAGACHGLSVAT